MGGVTSLRKLVGILIIAGLIMACRSLPVKATEPVRPIEHVILVSIDGLSYEGYASQPKSNIKYLAVEGVSAPRSLAVRTDTVEAAEATLLTGCLPSEHQYFTSSDKIEVESLLDVFQKSKQSILVVDGSGGKLRGFCHGDKEYIKVPSGARDAEVMERALAALKKHHPFFTYIYLNDCREAQLNPTQEVYYQALKLSDNEIGRLISLLKQMEIYDKTALVITAARSSSKSDMVPIVFKAPQLKPYSAVEGATVYDIAPTICSLVGSTKPYSSIGVTLWDAFRAQTEKEEMVLMKRRLNGLEEERLKNWIRYYELDRERLRLVRQIQEIKEERERVFGYAGERENAIGSLRQRLNYTRIGALTLITVLIMGYYVEYRVLKKKFTLFR